MTFTDSLTEKARRVKLDKKLAILDQRLEERLAAGQAPAQSQVSAIVFVRTFDLNVGNDAQNLSPAGPRSGIRGL